MALYYRSAISNLPDGYTFRGATFKDAPMVVTLFSQRRMSAGMTDTLEAIRQAWQTPLFNPAMDIRLVFDPRERLIGYIEVWSMLTPPAQPWLWGCVHPDYEGRGIGTTLLSWAEARARLALDLLPGSRHAARFAAPHELSSASALCANLGWRRITQPDPGPTGALRLMTDSDYAVDVYEKEM